MDMNFPVKRNELGADWQRRYKVFIMHGWSGSGKTTYVNENIRNYGKYIQYLDVVCSADDYMMVDGVYSWQADKLQDAHEKCQTKCEEAMKAEVQRIWIDNTNTKREDCEFYIMKAIEYKYQVFHIFCTHELGRYNGKAPFHVALDQQVEMYRNYGIGIDPQTAKDFALDKEKK